MRFIGQAAGVAVVVQRFPLGLRPEDEQMLVAARVHGKQRGRVFPP